jgi:FAD/FMN-containing dehydrogenase
MTGLPATGLRRRDLIRLAGMAGSASLLAACTGKGKTSGAGRFVPPPSPKSTPTTTATPTPSASPSGLNWSSLANQMHGKLLRPGGSGYASAAHLYNSRFDASAHPTAIAAVTTANDVAAAVRFAAENRVPFALRSGGHSYPGWSTSHGLVIDVSALNSVTVDTAHQRVRIGAGARLVDAYAACAAKGVGIPGGSCPTVGIAGLAQGGGIGVLSRPWGLTCDAIQSVDVVTADGTLRTVSASVGSDLFWAICGGGGGSFGAVTAFTLATRPAPTVSTFDLTWPFSAAGDVIDAWQSWIHTADNRINSTCKVLTDPRNSGRTPLIAGTWIGPSSELSAQLAPLLAKLPTRSSSSIHAHTYEDAMLLEAGCSGDSASSCLASALTPAKRQPFAATSSIVNGTIPSAAIDEVLKQATAALDISGLYESGISFDSLGGHVADLASDANAFGHRSAVATVQYTATWTDPSASAAHFDSFVRGMRSAMTPWLGSGAYVNYADASITNFGSAYWGANYPRLQQVKKAYDPDALFTFAQAVRPAG